MKKFNYSEDRTKRIKAMTDALAEVLEGSPLNDADWVIRRITLFINTPSDQNFADLMAAIVNYKREAVHSKSVADRLERAEQLRFEIRRDMLATLIGVAAADAKEGDQVNPETLPEDIRKQGGGWAFGRYFVTGAHKDGRSGWICGQVGGQIK